MTEQDIADDQFHIGFKDGPETGSRSKTRYVSILGIFFLLALVGTFAVIFCISSQDTNVPDSWKGKLSNHFRVLKTPTIQISGTYKLTNRDENFGDFLESLGMPRSHLSYLDKMEEKLTIIEGTKTNPNWTMILTTDFFVHKVVFVMDKTFNRSYDSSEEIESWQHHCTRISEVSFQCDTKYKDWNLNTKFIFNGTSVVEHKTNTEKKVETKKTYQRITNIPKEIVKNMKEGLTETGHANKVAKMISKTIEDAIDVFE